MGEVVRERGRRVRPRKRKEENGRLKNGEWEKEERMGKEGRKNK